MKYVILLLNTDKARSMTEAEGQAWYAEIGAWYEKGGGGSGKLAETGYQLAPPDTAKTVRASGVTDGPFIETKELVAGFWLWKCKSLQEAIEWVKRCPNPMPGESEIEIRQVFEAEDFGPEFAPELRAHVSPPGPVLHWAWFLWH